MYSNLKDILKKAEQKAIQQSKKLSNLSKILRGASEALEKENLKDLIDVTSKKSLRDELAEIGYPDILGELQKEQKMMMSKQRIEFDEKFRNVCHKLGIDKIEGNSTSEFRLRGMLRIKVNFQNGIVEIRTISAQPIKTLEIEAEAIATELKNQEKRLYSRDFDPQKFIDELYNGFKSIAQNTNQPVLLKDVHMQVWISKQTARFFEISVPEKMVPYPLDEFAVDVGRLVESNVSETKDGYICKIELGRGGINIYDQKGNFNAYKFIRFERRKRNDNR